MGLTLLQVAVKILPNIVICKLLTDINKTRTISNLVKDVHGIKNEHIVKSPDNTLTFVYLPE